MVGSGGGESVNWLRFARTMGITVRNMKDGRTHNTMGRVNFVGN
jgi:hypothetical protein